MDGCWTEKERQYENMDVVYLLALVSEINYNMNLFCFMSYNLTVESNLESPLSTADAMRDIQILFRKSPNGRFFISFQTHILTAKIK